MARPVPASRRRVALTLEVDDPGRAADALAAADAAGVRLTIVATADLGGLDVARTAATAGHDVALALRDDVAAEVRALGDATGAAVTCVRVAPARIEGFRALHDALVAAGIGCDSSVRPGDVAFPLAWSPHQPWFASRTDPQLLAPPAERALVELPVVASVEGARGIRVAEALARADRGPRTPAALRRLTHRALGFAFWTLRLRLGRRLDRVAPERLVEIVTPYPPPQTTDDAFFVVAGRLSRTDIVAVLRALARLRGRGWEVETLSALAADAREQLEAHVTATDAAAEVERQVAENTAFVLSEESNAAQSRRLQDLVPPGSTRVLDAGCGGGEWTAALARRLPDATITGIDVGADFVARAQARFGSDRVAFRVADFAALPFSDGAFDCVHADNALEHAFDVDATLAELHRVLASGGTLAAALPADARNPRSVCVDHTWKTAAHDVVTRLRDAGFVDVRVDEVDALRELGSHPFPPSRNRMIYAVGRRSTATASPDAIDSSAARPTA